MHYYSPDDTQLKQRSVRFIRRMFAMRQLGTFLCFFPFLSVLTELDRGLWLAILLAINAFIWPVIAWILAHSSRDPTNTERRNLTVDAAFGGVWVALMGLSPVPSFIIMAVLASDRYAAGGWPQLKSAIAAFLLAFIPVWSVAGMPLVSTFSTRTVWLTLPLATCYMLVLSAVSYQLTLTLRRKNRELERISLMDPSLKIPNRRLFDRRLESEYLRTQRGDSHAWLMLLDVDNFKQVNDRFGHEAGDYLLAEISRLLRNEVGTRDIPARFGGDELGVIVRDADHNSIVILAATLKEKIAQIRLPAAPDFQCSVSVGIAPAGTADSIHQWLRNADQALYNVKRTGRDGIHLWNP
ncbi:diguanylate cyclase [Erwinia sp. Eh17-17]|jgi:diguanylate cyclase (GGDEF)-like protein|uniref:diguanylate cyclase n=1 Tax=Erwinia sp. Eh17-17 TaxID=3080330 RepID=UPI003208DF3D